MTGIGVIPEKTINYRLFIDGSASPTALVDVDLPEIKMMSETISGAGITGEIESPTLGHTSSLILGLNIRSLMGEDFLALAQKSYTLELKAGMQSTDHINGVIQTGKLSIVAKGTPTGLTLGKLSVGKPTDSKAEFSLTYLKITYDGKEILEIDKLAMIHKVNGTDYLADLRDALGI